MITNDDIAKMAKVFATKEDIRQSEERLEDKFNEKHDRVMNGVDTVLKELIAVREDQVGHQLQHEDIQRDLDDIKSVSVIAQELKKKKR